MSPTAFDVGVTLTMSPNSWFTSAYTRQTSLPAVGQAQRPGLLVEVRVLPAGHLVL